MRWVFLLPLLTGCAVTDKFEEPEIIAGNAQEVSVKAGRYANPGDVASAHCAQYGRTAALRGQQPVDAFGRTYTFFFVCSGQ